MNKIISYAILLLIIVSLPFVNPDYKQKEEVKSKMSFTLAEVKSVFPEATEFTMLEDKSYAVLDGDKNKRGNFIVSNNFLESNSGYAGEVNVLIAFSEDKRITGGVLLDNVESRDYVRKVNRPEFMNLWVGKLMSEVPTMEVDAVSGATLTSSAVIRAVKESSAGYLSVVASYDVSGYGIVKIVLFLLVIVLSLIVSFRKNMSRFRMAYLIVVVIVSGFILQNMLSVALFDGWLKQGISLSGSWKSVVLLTMALVLPALGKNRYYCTYLCPMGAVQELTGKVSPFKKRSLRFLKFNRFDVSDIFLLLIVAAMFSSLSVDFTSVEPFTAYSVTIVSWGVLVFGGVVVILSLFFNKPWCAICPTGCVLNRLSLPKIIKKENGS